MPLAKESPQPVEDELPLSEEFELPNQNDMIVLQAIGGDTDAQNISFQGIKRKLGVHQETLSRSLRRLQRDGYVEHLEQGYKISSKGRETISRGTLNLSTPEGEFVREQYPVSILKAMLPEETRVQDIVSSLRYKWFGNLRWLGFGESGDSTMMSWITNDSNLKITVKIQEDFLVIESFAGNSGSISLAIRAAYELFDHITKVFKDSRGEFSSNHSAGKAA